MENKYVGMTVNERLYLSGLIDQFNKAVKKKKVDKIVHLLKKVELDGKSILTILEFHGLN